MNADTPNWTFVCILPMLLLAVSSVILAVVALARAVGRISVLEWLRPLRRVLVVGVPAILVTLGFLLTVTIVEHGDPPPLIAVGPLLVSLVFAVITGIALSRWAFPEWWAQRNRLLPPSRPLSLASRARPRSHWMPPAVIAIVVLSVVAVLFFFIRSGRPKGEGEVIGGVGVALVIGIGLAVLLLKVAPRWRAKIEANLRANAGRPRPVEPSITVLHALFTKMGAAILGGGVLLTLLFWVLTQSGILAVTFGGVFVFTVLALHASQLKAVARLSQQSSVVAPLLLTPDPTAVRGDCPTCGHAIPSDSPHGLCPRCLIRGAMPSPSSTRLRRGVSPIEPPSPAEVNEFFPHLEVLELIGAGGMGAVYKARQPMLDRVVALKIVQSPRGEEDPVFAERFAREARAMAKLDHPNIVTIHESGEAGGLPFLVMEYIDGVTLREAMANRLLTTVEALAVIPQVCDALDFAHRTGVVHRDIKPENILIDQTGRVKIADFGLAKLADPKNVTLTRTQQAMGTPHYMAPEQWEKPNDVDHRADVYALGVVLYELLTGELPLGRFALPSEKGKGDAKLDQVVIRSLAKDPAERFQNAGQMKAALSGVKLAAFTPVVSPKRRGYEYKSKTRLLGLPLVHVAAGWDPVTGKKRIAKGWIAVGDVMAVGGIAVGGVTGVGVVGMGGVAGCGLLGVGGALAIGALAIGGNAAGLLFALGGNAASMGLTIGGLAAGKFAIGGEAAGEYVISDTTHTPGFGDALLAWVRGFWPFS